MLNSISRLGETRPEQEWSNGTEFSGYSDFPEKRVHSKRIHKFSKTFPGIFTVPFSFGPEISVFSVEWKAPIDNQREREVRDCRDDTRQQPRNPSLFLRQSSLSVNNKMSSYQAAVEFDSNQESSDSDLSETILVNNREIRVYVLFPRFIEESNAFDS